MRTGNMDGINGVDFDDATYLSKHVDGVAGYETIYDDGDVDGSGVVDSADALYLARHVLSGGEMYPLYPNEDDGLKPAKSVFTIFAIAAAVMYIVVKMIWTR